MLRGCTIRCDWRPSRHTIPQRRRYIKPQETRSPSLHVTSHHLRLAHSRASSYEHNRGMPQSLNAALQKQPLLMLALRDIAAAQGDPLSYNAQSLGSLCVESFEQTIKDSRTYMYIYQLKGARYVLLPLHRTIVTPYQSTDMFSSNAVFQTATYDERPFATSETEVKNSPSSQRYTSAHGQYREYQFRAIIYMLLCEGIVSTSQSDFRRFRTLFTFHSIHRTERRLMSFRTHWRLSIILP